MRLRVVGLGRVVKRALTIEFGREQLTSYGGLELLRHYFQLIELNRRIRQGFREHDLGGDYGCVHLVLVVVGLVGMRPLRPVVERLLPARLHAQYGRFEHGTLNSFRGIPALVALTGIAWAGEVARLYLVTLSLGLGGIAQSVIVFVALAAAPSLPVIRKTVSQSQVRLPAGPQARWRSAPLLAVRRRAGRAHANVGTRMRRRWLPTRASSNCSRVRSMSCRKR